MPQARVTRISMSAPDDVSGIEAAIAAGDIAPDRIRAIFGKTEGNGCVNDFTRAFAAQSLRLLLSRHLPTEDVARVALVMSGGTEGGLAPHFLVIEVLDGDAAATGGALAVGVHLTRPMQPEEIGRMSQLDAVAVGVRKAMAEAGIATPEDVHFVQVKCPLLTAERIGEALKRGASPRTTQTLKSMGLSRGAASLGVAVALGEVPVDAITEDAIGSDVSLFSGRASASAGVELMANEIIVLGRSPRWSGPLRIDHAVMEDALDIDPVCALLERAGLFGRFRVADSERARVVAVLAKAESSSSGLLRGHRHTMLDDSDISPTRHARGFVAGALGSVVGHGEIYVSGGAEHQGPDGGGPVAVIWHD